MTDVEFRDWIDTEIAQGRMSRGQGDDLLVQKANFDRDKAQFPQLYPNQVVGYAGGTRIVGGSVQDVFARARQTAPKRMVYFEPIGFDIY